MFKLFNMDTEDFLSSSFIIIIIIIISFVAGVCE